MEAKPSKPFRVWQGDFPITEWFNLWTEEERLALKSVLDRQSQYSSWSDTVYVSFDIDPPTPELEDEASYKQRAVEELQRTRKRKESELEKKIKKYEQLKKELGL